MVNSVRRSASVRRVGIPAVVLLVSSLILSFTTANPAGADATNCASSKPTTGLVLSSFHATFSNGTMKLGNAAASGLSAQACGWLHAMDGVLVTTVNPTDITFPPVSVKVLFLKLPATVTVNAPLEGPVTFANNLTTVNINLAANLTASAKLLGFSCGIGPITPTLTTGTSGSLTGVPFTGSLGTGFSGTVVANDFAVPAISPSASCPRLVAALAGLLVGLPAGAGKASISMQGSIKTP
jgi:hypothetical protein